MNNAKESKTPETSSPVHRQCHMPPRTDDPPENLHTDAWKILLTMKKTATGDTKSRSARTSFTMQSRTLYGYVPSRRKSDGVDNDAPKVILVLKRVKVHEGPGVAQATFVEQHLPRPRSPRAHIRQQDADRMPRESSAKLHNHSTRKPEKHRHAPEAQGSRWDRGTREPLGRQRADCSLLQFAANLAVTRSPCACERTPWGASVPTQHAPRVPCLPLFCSRHN